MYVFKQELCLWKIESWYCEADTARAHNFLILASPHFLITAKGMEYKEERLQEIASGILKEAGFKIQDYEKFLRFGDFGIIHFEVPGNAY